MPEFLFMKPLRYQTQVAETYTAAYQSETSSPRMNVERPMLSILNICRRVMMASWISSELLCSKHGVQSFCPYGVSGCGWLTLNGDAAVTVSAFQSCSAAELKIERKESKLRETGTCIDMDLPTNSVPFVATRPSCGVVGLNN